MKKSTAIKYFGSNTALAKALSISTQSISQWPEEIPQRRAYEIERITNGALKADFTPVRQQPEQNH